MGTCSDSSCQKFLLFEPKYHMVISIRAESAQCHCLVMAANNTSLLIPIYPAEIVISGIFCCTMGSLSMLVNILTTLIIRKNKKLHTPCFTFLAAHTVYSFLYAMGFVNDGIQRLRSHLGRHWSIPTLALFPNQCPENGQYPVQCRSLALLA